MSTAFVQGKPRKTMPEVPDGFVKLKFNGKLGPDGTRKFQRPIPQVTRHVDPNDVLVVGKDRTCLATEAEAAYLLGLGGGFSKVPNRPSEMAEEVQDDDRDSN